MVKAATPLDEETKKGIMEAVKRISSAGLTAKEAGAAMLRAGRAMSSAEESLRGVMRKAVDKAIHDQAEAENTFLSRVNKWVDWLHPVTIEHFSNDSKGEWGVIIRFRDPYRDEYHLMMAEMNQLEMIRDPEYAVEKAWSEFTEQWRLFWVGGE